MARLLIVEDNVDLLHVLRELLEEEHEVHTAARGDDAVEIARLHPPDLVVLDLQLPGLDGEEAGRRIKQDMAPRHVPILVLSALAHMRTDDLLASGCCDAYLAKPAPIDQIRRTVTELLEAGSRAA